MKILLLFLFLSCLVKGEVPTGNADTDVRKRLEVGNVVIAGVQLKFDKKLSGFYRKRVLKVFDVKNPSQFYVMKIQKFDIGTDADYVARQIDDLQTCYNKHSNLPVMRYQGYDQFGVCCNAQTMARESFLVILSEFVDGADLESLITSKFNTPAYDGKYILTLAQKVFETVKIFHTNCDRVHLDLKPQNMVVTNGEDVSKLGVKLIDLEPSRRINNKFVAQAEGTMFYIAPETIAQLYNLDHDGIAKASADSWSLGLILYNILCSGKMPFSDNHEKMKKKFASKDVQTPDGVKTVQKDYSEEIRKAVILTNENKEVLLKKGLTQSMIDKFQELISGLLVFDTEKRITLDEAISKLRVISKLRNKKLKQ